MLAQKKNMKQALQRMAYSKPLLISQVVAKHYIVPLAINGSNQIRPLTIQKMSPKDSHRILVNQRLNRPLSPHLGIYKWQITSVNSSLMRITGAVSSGAFYIFGTAYLAAQVLGWHLGSTSIAAAFGALPVAAKVAAKFTLAWPFTFHSFNGVRHLTWDTGRLLKNQQVNWTGWTVLVTSTASALALATLY